MVTVTENQRTTKHGNSPIREKATGGFPIAQS